MITRNAASAAFSFIPILTAHGRLGSQRGKLEGSNIYAVDAVDGGEFNRAVGFFASQRDASCSPVFWLLFIGCEECGNNLSGLHFCEGNRDSKSYESSDLVNNFVHNNQLSKSDFLLGYWQFIERTETVSR